MTAGIYHDIDAATYHQRTLGVASKSALDEVHRSPAHYRAWVAGADKQTPAMVFGSLLHAYVLEPATCEKLYTIDREGDFGDCRKTENKAARDAWRAATEHLAKVSAEDWEKCRRMAESIQRHPIARSLLARAKTEVVMRWTDQETGLECKGRLDGLVDRRFILDLKTTGDASPEAFVKTVAGYRYHVQDAFYSDGFTALTGEAPRGFLFVAVEKTEPFVVATYQIDAQARERGRDLYRRDLATLKDCIETDEWPAYGNSTMTLSLPAWAMKGSR